MTIDIERKKEQERRASRKYYHANKGSCNARRQRNREKNREHERIVHRQWSRRHPERNSEKTAARRTATPRWADRNQIREFYREARRRTEETGIRHHVDHRFPIKHEKFSGLHVPWNLQVITAAENIRKSNRMVLA